MITRRDILAGTGMALIAAAWPARAAGESDADVAARRLFDDLVEEIFAGDPEAATYQAEDVGKRAALRGRLSDYSEAGREKEAARLKRRLAQLDALAGQGLSPEIRRHVDVVRYAYRSGLEGMAFPSGVVAVGSWRNSPYAVIQNVGGYIDVPQLLGSTQPVATPADAEAYLARLHGFARMLDDETERLRIATGRGVVPPVFLLDKALAQLRVLRAADPAKGPLVERLAKAFPERGEMAAKVVAGEIGPALDRQIAALEAQRAVGRSDAGVWGLPDGEAYYRWALEAATTTTRSPDEIHAQGLEELARLHDRMDALLRPLGYTKGSVGARMAALAKDPRYAFAEGDAGRAEIIAFCKASIDAVRPKLPLAFSRKGGGFLEILRIPESEELGAAGAYGGPGSADGTIPGKFRINLRSTSRWNRFNLPTLAYHEAVPGHVWQGEYSFGLPKIRSFFRYNAFNEGWGLYAEQLADELGVYEGNPVGQLGFLQSSAFRACRLVVDTGLHAKRWSREKAIAWFAEANGQGAEEVRSEVDRYCSWPGQACGYKVGHVEIVRMRERARQRLGTAYDLRAFNDMVLEAGWMPLAMLDALTEAALPKPS
jgi:uncharacterized protein (DUF885 family)